VPYSAPTAPGNLALIAHLGGLTYSVVVQGDYAYAGIGPKLMVFDISDPNDLVVVGQTPPLPGVVVGLDIAAGGPFGRTYAYLAAWKAGLVVDVSDPTEPAPVAVHGIPGNAGAVTVVAPESQN
jgi:hypothetical protein